MKLSGAITATKTAPPPPPFTSLRIRIALLGVFLLALCPLQPLGATTASLLYSNFESGTATGWTPDSAYWSVVTDGTYRYQCNPGYNQTQSLAGDAQWTDYTYAVTLKPLYFYNASSRLGITFRYQDAQNLSRFYYDIASDAWELHRTVNGNTQISRVYGHPFVLGTEYALRVEAKGNQIRTYVNNQLMHSVSGTNSPSGKVGLYASKGMITYDHISVLDGNAVFLDNFEHPNTFQPWTPNLPSYWSLISDGTTRYQVNPGYNVGLALAGDPQWDNTTFETRMKPLYHYTASTRIGVAFRYQDDNNHNLFLYNLSTAAWELHREINGTTYVSRVYGHSISLGSEYTLRIETEGTLIKTFVNGQAIHNVDAPGSPSGQIGLYTAKGMVSFDDVVVLKKPASQDVLVTYPVPAYVNPAPNYSIRVNGQPVTAQELHEGGYAHFAFAGKAHIEIRVLQPSTFEDFTLSPLNYYIPTYRSGNTISFTIDRPMKLVFFVNDDFTNRFYILAEGLEDSDTPNLGDPGVVNVLAFGADNTGNSNAMAAIQTGVNSTSTNGQILYFPPGVYNVGPGATEGINLPSNSTIYLAGGAYLRRTGQNRFFALSNVANPDPNELVNGVYTRNNIKIFGRGTLDGMSATAMDRSTAIGISQPTAGARANNVTLEGIIFKEHPGACIGINGEYSVLRNLKLLGPVFMYFNGNDRTRSEGIIPGSYCVIEDGIITTYDDNMNWSNARPDDPKRNLTLRNMVHASRERIATVSRTNGTYHSNFSMDNLHTIQCTRFAEFQNSNTTTMENFYLKNIVLERCTLRLGTIRGMPYWNGASSSAIEDLGPIRNFVYQNIYSTATSEPSYIFSRNPDEPVDGVQFRNYDIDGQIATDLTSGNVAVWYFGNPAYAQNITFAANNPQILGVRASDIYADTSGTNPGAFTFTRSGPTTSAITVPYTVRGSAAANVDYQSLSGSVTIPAGAASATVNITPIATADTSTKTVFVSILSSGFNNEYLIDFTSQAVVTIDGN